MQVTQHQNEGAGKILARFLYAKDDRVFAHEKPYSILTHFDGRPLTTTNMQWEEGEAEEVGNIRGNEGAFTLDTHGFASHHAPTTFSSWHDRQAIEEQYLVSTRHDMKRLLKDLVCAADEVEIFDWRVSAGWPDHPATVTTVFTGPGGKCSMGRG
jgi:hypothetical protein